MMDDKEFKDPKHLYDVAIKRELDMVPQGDRGAPKLSPTQAGLTSDHRDPKHQCRTCWMFCTDGRCGQVGMDRPGEIKPIGTCDFWRFGKPMEPSRFVRAPIAVTKVESHYMEREEGFQCGTCQRYDADNKRCGSVFGQYTEPFNGDIQPEDCCDHWTDGEAWVPEPEAEGEDE